MTTHQAVARKIEIGIKIDYVRLLFNQILQKETDETERRSLTSLVEKMPSPSSVETKAYVESLSEKLENKFVQIVEVNDAQLEELAKNLGENLMELNIARPPTSHYEQKECELREKLTLLFPLIGKDDPKKLCLRLLALKVEIDDFFERTQGNVDFTDGERGEMYVMD